MGSMSNSLTYKKFVHVPREKKVPQKYITKLSQVEQSLCHGCIVKSVIATILSLIVSVLSIQT